MGYLGWVLTIDGGAGGEVSGMTSPRRCRGEGLDAGRVGLAEPSRQPFVKHGT